ncbi:MAG TPA: choice-of-anchor Q domain-containing protein [Baekduia sp.]|uniref:choice-of-anchor Q domain-containing protein n=1 Tax=Baekduia sp. TaxID=2600305 RepID=UPI002CBFC17B|nr:choice-of-anchor Q domain-containing protein [Baekduia sp.]HMJ36966.1 choice-of-anchor Q domain-containing protein [Baekduia sp.]
MLFAVPVASAHASITVANTSDAGAGSLRQAVVDAAPGETVVLPAGTYTLTSGELAVAKSVTISGHGTADTIVRAGGAFRVLHTSGASSAVVISGLTLRDGHVVSSIAQGGGVLNQGAALTLSDVAVTNNRADSDGVPGGAGSIAYGGGILSETGALTLLRAQVTGNTATASGGDGIPPNGNGGPGSIAEGGGLMSSGALTVLDATFSGNAATATGGRGAGTGNGGPGSIAYAGGVLIAPGALTASVTASSITGNVGDASGGAHGPAGGTAGAGGTAQGGGVKATVSGSVLTFGNVTVAANIARSSSTGTVQGGGVFAAASGSGKVRLTNATLSANGASGPAGATGGNLQPSGSVELRDTILAAGTAMAGTQNCSAATTSLGHNLEDTAPSHCGLAATGDRVGADPLLAPLQANGGLTSTMALLGASPAIDAGDASCRASDQRGVVRPQGAACDIGAYELAPGAATTGAASAVTMVSADVSGTATNPDAAGATASFQYGSTTAYGLATATQPVAPAAAAAPFAGRIVALAPATTYHFRLVMTNAAGTAVGADQTFVTPAGPTAPSPPVLVALPVLSGLSLSPTSFRASASAKTITKRAGTTVKYKLTRAARVRFTVERATKGRRVHGTCAAAKRSNAGKPACVRYVTVAGSLTRASTAGANRFRFAGRLGGRALPAGGYRLRAVATDLGGRRSVAKLVRFRIAKR